MYSQQELDDAVASGVITADAAAALRVHIEQQRATAIPDEEQFRLLTGFNDIFVSIAAAQPMWDSGPCATLGTSITREWRNCCAARWPSSVGMFGSRSPEKISTGTSANSPLVC